MGRTVENIKTAKKKKTEARQAERNKWKEKLKARTSLETYRAQKVDMRKDNYDNTKGSHLPFEARAGCLRIKTFVGKYAQNDGVCAVCGKERETMRHIVLQCECIHPKLYEGNIELPEALAFKGSAEVINFKAVEVT